jgi:hypothetical protein
MPAHADGPARLWERPEKDSRPLVPSRPLFRPEANEWETRVIAEATAEESYIHNIAAAHKPANWP